MNQWNFDLFNKQMGNEIEFGIVQGKAFSGKSETCKILNKNHDYEIIDMGKIKEAIIKSKTGEDEEPDENLEIPMSEIEKVICDKFSKATAAGGRAKFVFDGFAHGSVDSFLSFVNQLGTP